LLIYFTFLYKYTIIPKTCFQSYFKNTQANNIWVFLVKKGVATPS
jgi:hypothetical protein